MTDHQIYFRNEVLINKGRPIYYLRLSDHEGITFQ